MYIVMNYSANDANLDYNSIVVSINAEKQDAIKSYWQMSHKTYHYIIDSESGNKIVPNASTLPWDCKNKTGCKEHAMQILANRIASIKNLSSPEERSALYVDAELYARLWNIPFSVELQEMLDSKAVDKWSRGHK